MSKKETNKNQSPTHDNETSTSPQTGSENREKRRKVLRNTLIGGAVISTGAAVPGKWSKPALEAVILPTHAATTDSGSGSTGNTTTTTSTPTTTAATTTTTTCIPNANANIFCTFNFSSWTEQVV